jgi:hypothetical protein
VDIVQTVFCDNCRNEKKPELFSSGFAERIQFYVVAATSAGSAFFTGGVSVATNDLWKPSAFASFRFDAIRTERAFLKPEANEAVGCGHSQPCAQ